MRSRLAAGFWRMLVLLSVTMTASSASLAAAAGADAAVAVNGYFFTRYVLRSFESTSSESLRDQDVYGELRIDATTPRSGRYEFHFLGSVRKDLDANSDHHTHYPLEDTGNAQNKDTLAVILEAHLDINRLLPTLTQLRLGRQSSTRDTPALFDGIALDFRPASFMNLSVYGGRTINLYEVNGTEGTDTLRGAGIDLLPTSSTAICVDYLAIVDERSYFDQNDVHDRLLAFKLTQRFTRNIRALARYRYQNGERRDVNVRLLGSFPGAGVELGASYTRQLRTQYEQTNALSPFYDVLGASLPYQSLDLKFRKALGTSYFLDLGYFRRELYHPEQAGTNNREYSRTFAGVEVSDLLLKNLSCTITGEIWTAEELGFFTAGADLSYAFGNGRAKGKASVGSYYSLYKYDSQFLTDEHDRVRTYYAKTKVPLIRQTSLDLLYEWEDGVDTFQTMKVGLRYDF